MSTNPDSSTPDPREPWVGLLVFPGLWCALAAAGSLQHKSSPGRVAGVGNSDLAILLVPAVLIYGLAVLSLRRRLGDVTAARAAVFSLCAAVLTVLADAGFFAVINAGDDGNVAGVLYHWVLPVVPPFLAICAAYWLVVVRPRRMEFTE